MIKDIPTEDDFNSAAKAQFEFAWDIVISFLITINDANRYTGMGIDEEDKAGFWEAARQRVLTSLIVTQQGIELAIKAKLVAVSPFLLISGSYSEWPKDKKGDGISFSEFRSIDAQDLIKVHDAVHENSFNDKFVELFEDLRKLRNKAMHTVDSNLSVSAEEVAITILEAHTYLYPEENWISTRREFLDNAPAAQVFFDIDHVNGLVAKEFFTIFELLTPSQVNRLFKIDKKQRLYICPECNYEAKKYESFDPKYAVLQPNNPESESLFCFVCNQEHPITRLACKSEDCLGNVVSVEYDCCCTCGEDQSD